MFDINSILSILPISSQSKKVISLLSKDIKSSFSETMASVSNASKEKANKYSHSKKMTNTKQKTTQQQTKDTKQKTQSTTNKKDICQQDCICDDILNKKTNKSQYILSNMTNEELKKYILFSDVLGTPVCKKRRMY